MQYNPKSVEVSRKMKKISQLARDKKRAEEVEKMRSNVDLAKHLDELKSEMVSLFVKLGVMIFYITFLP